MDRRLIQDVYLSTEQLPYIHILTLNLLLRESQQAGRKQHCRDQVSHAQSVQSVEKNGHNPYISLITLHRFNLLRYR